jgi:hypothetical protein
MRDRWMPTIVQGFGAGILVLAVLAWLDGNAGPVHIAMAVLGLVLVFSDLIFAPSRWRQVFAKALARGLRVRRQSR